MAKKNSAGRKRRWEFLLILVPVLLLVAWVSISILHNQLPSEKYKKAVILMESGNYEVAKNLLKDIKSYEDAEELYTICRWHEGLELYRSGMYSEAEDLFELLTKTGRYPDFVTEGIDNYWRETARRYAEKNMFSQFLALSIASERLNDPAFAEEIHEIIYQAALANLEADALDDAINAFSLLDNYKDSADRLADAQLERSYRQAVTLFQEGSYNEARDLFLEILDYKDCRDYIQNYYVPRLAEERTDYGTENTIDSLYQYVYDEEGFVIEKNDPRQQYQYTYENGLPVQESITGENSSALIEYHYTFHENGQIATKEQRWITGDGIIGPDMFLEYDEEGKLITETWQYRIFRNIITYDCRLHYQYDEEGRLQAKVCDELDADGNVIKEALYTQVLLYDEAGRLIQCTNPLADEGSSFRYNPGTVFYFYDDFGNRIKEETYRYDYKIKEEALHSITYYTYEWIYSPQN